MYDKSKMDTHNIHSDISFTAATNTKLLDVCSALWSNNIHQVNKQGKTEQDKLSSLKPKLFLFSCADAEQQK